MSRLFAGWLEGIRRMNEQAGSLLSIRRREALSEDWYRLEKVTFDQRREDGSSQTLQREVYWNGPGAAVLPIDRDRNTVLLVRQLRIPAHLNGDGPMLVEVCAGMVEAGDDPAETVRKEAEQEMGFRLRSLRKVFQLYMSPGASAEKLHLFVADYAPSDRIGNGGGLAGEGERIELLEVPLAQAWDMINAGQIIDAKTVLLLQHMRLNVG
jgi:nudix-type nucleoside diphosphatase (YffH/AdpP family)